jgi:hypothetical protein
MIRHVTIIVRPSMYPMPFVGITFGFIPLALLGFRLQEMYVTYCYVSILLL